MKIAIVDDDEKQRSYLSSLISVELAHLGDMSYRITQYRNSEEFLCDWAPEKFDLIILDIYMDKMTGIELAYKIREGDEHVILAFCTSSNEFASESYDVGAKHYIRKPITPDNISRVFKKIDLDAIEKTRMVKLPNGESILVRNVLYTEYENHVITVYIKNESPCRVRTSQTEIEALLLPFGYFCSPYKGITVNFHAVSSMTDSNMVLSDGTSIPITRRKVKEVKEAYKRFKYLQMRREVGA